jgi:hypothetical protein
MSRVLIRSGLTTVVLLTLHSSAHAWTDKTPALRNAPGGYVYCRVTATSDTPIGIVATIVSNNARNVTEFGYGSREKTDDGYKAEETAGSFNAESSRYHCKFTVTRARKKNVRASLTAFDSAGTPIATVEAR